MASYETVNLPLDERQVDRLSKGEAVRLKHSELSATEGVPVCLTKTQVARIAKAKAASKGVQIKLSQAQIAACCHHTVGGSVFSTAVTRAKDYIPAAASAAKGLAASLLEQYGQKGLDAAHGAVDNLVASSKLPDYLKPFAEMGTTLGSKYASNQLQALLNGMRQTKNGSGLFAPGSGGGGLFLPGTRGGSLSEMTSFELDEFIQVIRKQVRHYVADTTAQTPAVASALDAFDKDCSKLYKVLAANADERPENLA